MNEREMKDLVERAIRSAQTAWARAHEGLPTNPMTRTAAIPAVGALAAAILSRLPADDDAITETAYKAILMARRAMQDLGGDAPSNPMARTAERAAVGVVAAGIVNHSSVVVEPEEGCTTAKS
jgi:hypothetical protein